MNKLNGILFFVIIIILMSCDKDSDPYFDYTNIDLLELENIDNFWTQDRKIDTSFYMGATFDNHPGFINGIRLSNNGKAIWISVFETQEDALDAMELRINSVACIINEGTSNVIDGKWWYSECLPYMVFVNHYNTIVEVDFSSNATFDVVEDILFNTANEVKERMTNHITSL